jgi:hypothetical protein
MSEQVSEKVWPASGDRNEHREAEKLEVGTLETPQLRSPNINQSRRCSGRVLKALLFFTNCFFV